MPVMIREKKKPNKIKMRGGTSNKKLTAAQLREKRITGITFDDITPAESRKKKAKKPKAKAKAKVDKAKTKALADSNALSKIAEKNRNIGMAEYSPLNMLGKLVNKAAETGLSMAGKKREARAIRTGTKADKIKKSRKSSQSAKIKKIANELSTSKKNYDRYGMSQGIKGKDVLSKAAKPTDLTGGFPAGSATQKGSKR